MKTNLKHFTFVIIGLAVFGYTNIHPTQAAVINERTFRLNQATVQRGYTVTDVQGNFRLGISGGVFATPQMVSIGLVDNVEVTIPTDRTVMAGPFRVAIPTMTTPTTAKPLTLRISYSKTGSGTPTMVFYNNVTNAWETLSAKFANGTATVTVTKLNGYFAIWATMVKAPVISSAPPKVSSIVAMVVNNLTGQVLYQKNANSERPMASLTKLMTAMVFLEHNPGFGKVVNIDQSDDAIGAKLHVQPGETLTVKDVFYTMLVGSANNCAKALARSTGLTRAQFVAEMNLKAKQFGLAHTKFTDPSGLDVGNITTAEDYLKLTDQAMKQLDIKKATTTKVYSFKMINTKTPHTIKNTNALITSALTLITGKTGYLDEAGYCLMTRAKSKTGTEVTAIVLGSGSKTQSFKEVESLIKWGFGM